MILIADSGSTKTDWVLLNSNGQILFETQTAVLNPQIINQDFILTQLNNSKHLTEIRNSAVELYFYGAGCSSVDKIETIYSGLKTFFNSAKIEVQHDLMGAAKAVWKGHVQLVGILGTGSNLCWFNGKEISQHKPSLGYLLGDEGSGNKLGGLLYRAIVHKTAPQIIINEFTHEFNSNKKDLVSELYNQPQPNKYLASFVPFIKSHSSHPFIKELIFINFEGFVETYILPFEDYKELETHFIGSIAYHFKQELQVVFQKWDLQLGGIIARPIEGLIEYHKKTLNKP
jgi:N-acetylglucosamine kinase-like BadF-type ATPase